jgi:hypothetical protein
MPRLKTQKDVFLHLASLFYEEADRVAQKTHDEYARENCAIIKENANYITRFGICFAIHNVPGVASIELRNKCVTSLLNVIGGDVYFLFGYTRTLHYYARNSGGTKTEQEAIVKCTNIRAMLCEFIAHSL